MIDLSNLKAGDTAFFRCGGCAIVRIIQHESSVPDCFPYYVGFNTENDENVYHYLKGGQHINKVNNSPFDIIKIENARNT